MALTIGNQIKAARALVGWDQSELAKAAGVDPNTIRNLEASGAEPLAGRLDTLRKVQSALEALGIEFLNGGSPGDRSGGHRRAVRQRVRHSRERTGRDCHSDGEASWGSGGPSIVPLSLSPASFSSTETGSISSERLSISFAKGSSIGTGLAAGPLDSSLAIGNHFLLRIDHRRYSRPTANLHGSHLLKLNGMPKFLKNLKDQED